MSKLKNNFSHNKQEFYIVIDQYEIIATIGTVSYNNKNYNMVFEMINIQKRRYFQCILNNVKELQSVKIQSNLPDFYKHLQTYSQNLRVVKNIVIYQIISNKKLQKNELIVINPKQQPATLQILWQFTNKQNKQNIKLKNTIQLNNSKFQKQIQDLKLQMDNKSKEYNQQRYHKQKQLNQILNQQNQLRLQNNKLKERLLLCQQQLTKSKADLQIKQEAFNIILKKLETLQRQTQKVQYIKQNYIKQEEQQSQQFKKIMNVFYKRYGYGEFISYNGYKIIQLQDQLLAVESINSNHCNETEGIQNDKEIVEKVDKEDKYNKEEKEEKEEEHNHHAWIWYELIDGRYIFTTKKGKALSLTSEKQLNLLQKLQNGSYWTNIKMQQKSLWRSQSGFYLRLNNEGKMQCISKVGDPNSLWSGFKL